VKEEGNLSFEQSTITCDSTIITRFKAGKTICLNYVNIVFNRGRRSTGRQMDLCNFRKHFPATLCTRRDTW